MMPSVCPDPLFIVGAPRSGTSALAWALDQHSAFWASSESDFLVHLFGNARAETAFDMARAMPNSWLAQQQVELPEFLECLGYGVNALFTSHSGGRRWIDKSPTYPLMMDLLGMMFPGARFVHIVRGGPAVVHSMLNSGFQELWATDFVEACRTWNACVTGALDFEAAFPARCLTVRHEDLTEDPDAVFRSVFDFLRVADEPGPAWFLRQNRINSSFASVDRDQRNARAVGRPWSQWSSAQQHTFLTEAADAVGMCRSVRHLARVRLTGELLRDRQDS